MKYSFQINNSYEKLEKTKRKRNEMAVKSIWPMIPSTALMFVFALVSYVGVLSMVMMLRGYCEENGCGARRMFVNAGH